MLRGAVVAPNVKVGPLIERNDEYGIASASGFWIKPNWTLRRVVDVERTVQSSGYGRLTTASTTFVWCNR